MHCVGNISRWPYANYLGVLMFFKIYRLFAARISRSIPYIRLTSYLREYFNRSNPYFVGWGMTTHSYPPWHLGKGDVLSLKFHATNEDFLSRVRDGSFTLTQLRHFQVGAREEFVRGLSWRHFIVTWSVLWSARSNRGKEFALVECGVCDGMTAYFAMRALEGAPFRFGLYDAWAPMKTEHLLLSEKKAVGAYGYLSLETTIQNLAMFKDECRFTKGYIPESLSSSEVSREVNWLHLDLNSSTPTIAALEFFWDRMASNSVILFDDYLNERETKNAVDRFFAGRNGVMLPLPTNQAIYFRF